MSGGPAEAREPSQDAVRELLSWRPRLGVLSIYVDAGMIERDGRWRIELRNDLERLAERVNGGDAERRAAIEATVRRVRRGLLAERGEVGGRGLSGFIEVADDAGEERWYGSQLAPRRTEASYGERARVGQLLATLDDGAPVGVAALSAERVRLFDWRLARFEQLHDWELSLFNLDWRERKAPSPARPTGGRFVSSAGRDQHDQRIEANRRRFARQTGGLARLSVGRRGWRQLLVFGDQRYAGPFSEGFADRCALHHLESADLVAQPTRLIAERVERLLPGLNRERERALIERITEAAYAEARSSFGAQETLQALEQGRVEHLVYDAGLQGAEVESMVDLALASGAAVTPVEGESASALERRGGVAALLRY